MNNLDLTMEIVKLTKDYLSCDFFPHKSRNGTNKRKILKLIKQLENSGE